MALTPNTLGLQRTRVRLLVQETTASYWSDDILNQYINEAQFSIACGLIPGKATGLESPLLASEATTASVANQELYSMPPNLHGLRNVRMRESSTATYSEKPIVDIDYARSHPRDPVTIPEAYFLWGESGTYQVGLYPAFNTSNGTIYVSYWRLPDTLTSDSTTLQIPVELHIANTYLASHKAWLERSHDAESQKLLEMFRAEYDGAAAYINRMQINQKRGIMVGVIGDTDTERTLY